MYVPMCEIVLLVIINLVLCLIANSVCVYVCVRQGEKPHRVETWQSPHLVGIL